MTDIPICKNNVLSILKKQFGNHFSHDPAFTAYAPGRVEILGNHTDYNEGFVLSAAINMGTFFVCSPANEDSCRLVAGDLMEETGFNINNPEPVTESSWSNYVRGVVDGLGKEHHFKHGFNAMFLGNIPLGAGLSSSAALEISCALALSALYGLTVDNKLKLAQIGQRAEHLFAGVNCGLLDQITSLYGHDAALVFTDFRTNEVAAVPLGSEVCLLMCNTHAKHALNDSAYNQRRRHCEQAAKELAKLLPHPVSHLRDVSLAEFINNRHQLDSTAARRAAHIVEENSRVENGVELLKQGKVEAFGKLMFESHESSRNNFENSCAELDLIVETAKHIPGVLGARLSGGGFGGSAVVLVKTENAAPAEKKIKDVYQQEFKTDCDVRILSPSAGAHIC